jgi:hypothetical protein
MQPESIAPARRRAEIGARAIAAGVLVIIALSAPGSDGVRASQTSSGGIGASIRSLGAWAESPAHVRLFAPSAHQSDYRAFVSTAALDEVVRGLAAAQPGPPGAWQPESVSPLDAFGSSGGYNRFQVARLYLGNRPRTARGPWATPDGLESWTLVSPYPNAALDAVEPGTLLLALRVPPL